jgi:hypothetical protein
MVTCSAKNNSIAKSSTYLHIQDNIKQVIDEPTGSVRGSTETTAKRNTTDIIKEERSFPSYQKESK